MKRIGLSFSGGKDSVLALYKLLQQGFEIKCLMTTVWKESGETVAHNEKQERLEQQAEMLGIPMEWIVTDFENYTLDFERRLKGLKELYDLEAVAFGDIYLEGHREWGEKLARAVKLAPLYPLWMKQEESISLLDEFVKAGFKARIIKVDEKKLPIEWVGREMDESFIQDILAYNEICPLGESGEYHTYVYDGPIFKVDRYQS